MAEDDIYNSERKYLKLKADLPTLVSPQPKKGKRKYFCKNPANLAYFRALFARFEAKDISYIRRLRLAKSFGFILHNTEKDLKDLNREDIDKIVANMHIVCKSPKSKSDFIKDLKYMWKVILPEKDREGRADETLVPYVVRHLSAKVDRSKEKTRGDKLSFEEYEKLLGYFSRDIRLQCYFSLAIESISRPQEILFRRIKDIELHDNYARIIISDHGKEGTGFMQCIDSYPYLVKLLESHPFKSNPEAFLFINNGHKNLNKQMTPINVNQQLKTACTELGISKNITCYSLKRNGVTFRRLSGQSDMEIQHAARWTSTRQLKTYDMSNSEEAFKIQLIKKGIIKADRPELQQYQPENKKCLFCNMVNAATSLTCSSCKRPLNRATLAKLDDERTIELNLLKGEIDTLKQALEIRKPYEDMLAQFLQSPQVQDMFKKALKEQHLLLKDSPS
ncbi:MAG: tyrosine-type recombinase/integrase [Candidatus Woesearchaeota archaeon]